MGFLDFLTRGLKKTRSNLVVQVDGISGKLTHNTFIYRGILTYVVYVCSLCVYLYMCTLQLQLLCAHTW